MMVVPSDRRVVQLLRVLHVVNGASRLKPGPKQVSGACSLELLLLVMLLLMLFFDRKVVQGRALVRPIS
jgi:hypothetical protein